MNGRADWLAWVLQLIVGFVVGAIVALYCIARFGSRGPWEHAAHLVIGAGFFGGGLASLYGDQLWIGSSYRVIPPDDIRHSQISKLLSIVISVIGGVFILLGILKGRHFLS